MQSAADAKERKMLCDAQDVNGWTALHLAAKRGHIGVSLGYTEMNCVCVCVRACVRVFKMLLLEIHTESNVRLMLESRMIVCFNVGLLGFRKS